MSKVIDVTDLPEPLIAAIESLVDTYRAKAVSGTHGEKVPPIGWLKGKWELPSSFFDPLPEEILESFEGGRGTS